MFENNELIGYFVLSIVAIVAFFIVIFIPLWREVQETKHEAQEKRLLREKNLISFSLNYFFAKNDRIEAVVTDINHQTGEVSVDIILHTKDDDTILGAPDDCDLNNVRLPVRHVDGTYETLSFDIANDMPIAFAGWEIVIDNVLAKAG